MKTYWKGRSVLVTGCTGFLGSWLVAVLLKKGATVTGIVRDSVRQSNLFLNESHKRVNIVMGDVQDTNLIKRTLTEYGVDTVFHLAAQALVNVATTNPYETFRVNVGGTLSVLEAIRGVKSVKRLVVASTDKVYGDQTNCTEDSPLLGVMPYEASKIMVEQSVHSYYKNYLQDTPVGVGITRCANIFGGGDMNLHRLVPKQIISAIEGNIIRYNSCKRQFIYMMDAVRAYLDLAEGTSSSPSATLSGQVFNFGLPSALSIADFTWGYISPKACKGTVYRVLYKKDVEPKLWKPGGKGWGCDYSEYPLGEIKEQSMEVDKAHYWLGFQAKVSLAEGIKETFAWYKLWLKGGNMRKFNDSLLEKF